jgi:hypothetical protein
MKGHPFNKIPKKPKEFEERSRKGSRFVVVK